MLGSPSVTWRIPNIPDNSYITGAICKGHIWVISPELLWLDGFYFSSKIFLSITACSAFIFNVFILYPCFFLCVCDYEHTVTKVKLEIIPRTTVHDWSVFRGFHNKFEKVCILALPCLSLTRSEPLHDFLWKFMLGNFTKFVSIPILVLKFVNILFFVVQQQWILYVKSCVFLQASGV